MYKKSAILLIPENVEVPNELCSIDERSASLGGNGRRRFVLHFVRLAVLSQFRSGFPDSTFAWVHVRTRSGRHAAGGDRGKPEHFRFLRSSARKRRSGCTRSIRIVTLFFFEAVCLFVELMRLI